MHIAIYPNPRKQSVIERLPLLGEFVIRGSAVYVNRHPNKTYVYTHVRMYVYTV